MSARPDRWLVRQRPDPNAALRVFCFPHAGGGASAFRDWAGGLPASIELCAVQLPGRETRLAEAPIPRLEPLVEAVGEGLRPWMDRPYAFFGHSTGALLAFELARALRAAGRGGPAHLFASARPAPHLPRTRPPTYGLPDDALIADLRALGGVPEEVLEHRELMGLLLRPMRADLEVNETYVHEPGAPLDVPVTAYGGTDDPRAPRESLEAWAEHTRGSSAVRIFPGGHFYLHEHRADVLRSLAADLAASGALPGV